LRGAVRRGLRGLARQLIDHRVLERHGRQTVIASCALLRIVVHETS
jgi:hypothetical protein